MKPGEAWTREDVDDQVVCVLCEIANKEGGNLEPSKVRDQDKLEDLGIDSQGVVDAELTLEKEFSISLNCLGKKTVGDIVDYVCKQLGVE